MAASFRIFGLSTLTKYPVPMVGETFSLLASVFIILLCIFDYLIVYNVKEYNKNIEINWQTKADLVGFRFFQ